MQELAYASYLNVSVAVLPPPRNRAHVPSYARAIHTCLDKIPYMHLSVRVPVYDPTVFQLVTPTPRPTSPALSISASSTTSGVSTASSKSSGFPQTTEEEFNTTWEMWDVIRTICESNPRLSLSKLFV
jgi:protein arginine N-methyltransferase 5